MSDLSKQVLQKIMDGETIKIPCARQDHADLIRMFAHQWVLAVTEEPMEFNPPFMEVWIRKLTGGRPTTFACGCSKQGSEDDMNGHCCLYYPRGYRQ